MTTLRVTVVTALAVLAALTAGRTLSSDPGWNALSGKGTEVAMEELTLSHRLSGEVDITFRSDYFGP